VFSKWEKVKGKVWSNLSSYYGVVWVCSGNIRTNQNAINDSRDHSSLAYLWFPLVGCCLVASSCSEGSSSHPAIILICNQCVEVHLSRL